MHEAHLRFLRNAHLVSRLVDQVLERGYLRKAAAGDLTFEQLNLLKFLGRPATTITRDVSRFLDASMAAASKAVGRLTAKGLVRRKPSGTDRRCEVLEVTAKGRELVRRYETLKAGRLRKILGTTEADRMAGALEEVVELLLSERPLAGNPCLGCGAYYSQTCMIRARGLPARCCQP